MKLSIVIPVYNEKDNIKITIEELLSVVRSTPGIDKLQMILVDDHSSDNTFDIVSRISHPEISCLRLSRRCGSHSAIRAGLRDADGDVVLSLSADGQDDPAALKDMLDKWHNGARVVWALRRSRHGEPWYIRKPAQVFYSLLMWLGGAGGTGIDISRANFCLLDKIVVNAINKCQERNTSLFGLIVWLGFNQDFVEYQRRMRRFGKSKWNFRSQLRLARDWVVAFSGLPLTLILVIGFFVTITGLLYVLYLAISFIQGRAIQSPSVILASIFFLGGIQMIMLGIIGEYLWNNLDEARHRPLFFIEKRSDKHD
ncbi:MAG: glycosyltransferase family 2 protein [Candidatus Omnitrophota bacterium]|nr:glycosyltransferase family 2 protein [Candidatus Omnitrophota bacterium]